ncbi:PAR14 polymerase, partial [Polypterus senegalus]|nr:PAR14 polymerase [Polypterus senegalus]
MSLQISNIRSKPKEWPVMERDSGQEVIVCKSIKNNHTEVLEAAVIKALEYVKTQGQTSVSIYCPLDKDLNTSIQAATVAAALEGFCKAQSYLFVSALSVFIVCPNETEWANIMKKNLEIVWACSNSKQNGMQEVIPVIPQNISVRLVSGTLEENQVQAIVVPVTVSARTNSIKLSSLCTHKPSCNLEELLQIQSSCLVDKLLKGQIIPVTCRGSGLLCEYLYLMEVQDDWRDPVEKLRGLMYKFATLSHRLLLTSLAVPVLDLSRHKVQSSQVVKWLLEGLKMFERETSFSWLHSVWLVLSPDCTDFKPLGICFADHPFFIQYLQDSKQAFMEISLKLKKTSSSFSIFKMSKKCCLSVSPRGYVSGGMSLSKWKTEQGKVYNSLRSRYSVKSHYIPNLTQVEKYEPALKKLQSVKVSEHERCVVGLTEEVNKYIQIADLNRHVKETFSNKIWGDLSEKAIQHVAKDLQLELVTHFPGVIALQDKMKPPNTIFQGPYKSMYSAIDVFMKLISKALLCVFLSDKLSDYKCSFLKSWNLSVLSQTLFHARNIRATLKVQHSCLIIQGGSFEDNQRAMEVLNDDIYETEIRISHASQASTMGVKWSKQLKDISYTFNKSQKKVEIHTIPHEDNINIKVLLVGFKTEVHAAKCILDQHFHDNTDIKGIVEFKQPHLVEASHRIVEIIEEKNLLGVKLEVNIYTNSKVEIILTGPRSEVHKAQEILKRDLNSVVVKSMKIEGLGAAHYFQDPKTTEILKAVGSAYFCIITVRTQQSIAPRRLEDEKFICDSRIEKLTPDELHAVTKDLGIMLHRGDGGLSLEGLKTHVDEAQTRLEDILKTVCFLIS